MPDYESLYHILFNKITDIVEDLKEVQRLTEEIYVIGEETQGFDIKEKT